MDAKQIKLKLQGFLLGDGRIFAADEINVHFSSVADILSLDKWRSSYEYEIKVSKQDLDSEIEVIQSVYKGQKGHKKSSKFFKHSCYLELYDSLKNKYKLSDDYNDHFFETYLIPNFYYFVVPEELSEHAKKTVTSPYGIMKVYPKKNGYIDKKVIKRARRIHERGFNYRHIDRILSKISWRNYELNHQSNSADN